MIFFAKYLLRDRVRRLERLQKSIKEDQLDISSEKSKYYTILYDLRLALEECRYSYTFGPNYELIVELIDTAIADLNNAETGEQLKDISTYVLSLFDGFDYEGFRFSDVTNTYRSFFHMESNLEAVRPIKRMIDKCTRNVTVFEPDCCKGEALRYLSYKKEDTVLTYGTEDTAEANEARRHITKLGRGELRGSKIKNDAFDFIYAKCNIGYTLDQNMRFNLVAKREKELIMAVHRYLRPRGVVAFVIPYFRMHKDICEHIAKSYDNVIVYKSTNPGSPMLYIYGQKSDNKLLNEDTYNMLRYCYNIDNVQPYDDSLELDYHLPLSHIEIDLFKGSQVDQEELHDIIENSGALDDFFDAQNIEKIGESTTSPLLPFNIGQLGLVLTSGCLDGIIDEGDGHCHLVKGRVSKKSDSDTEIEDGKINESEIISNRVEINILLPNGEFKTLT